MHSFKNLAKLIRQKRCAQDITQTELSQLLGYKNGQFISNVERALCSIPLKMRRPISEILDIAYDEIKTAILKDHEETFDNYFKGS